MCLDNSSRTLDHARELVEVEGLFEDGGDTQPEAARGGARRPDWSSRWYEDGGRPLPQRAGQFEARRKEGRTSTIASERGSRLCHASDARGHGRARSPENLAIDERSWISRISASSSTMRACGRRYAANQAVKMPGPPRIHGRAHPRRHAFSDRWGDTSSEALADRHGQKAAPQSLAR